VAARVHIVMFAPVSPDALLDAEPDVFAPSSESPPHAATSADTATVATMPSHAGFLLMVLSSSAL